jgi:hypothetical protein
MTRALGVVMAGVAVLLSGAKDERPAPVEAPPIRQIADVTLRDVAVAVYDAKNPVIYYNPVLLGRLGPELTQFFMAHEHAHIALKHTRSGALGTGVDQRNRALQQKELAADCLATRTLGPEHRAAAEAAARFFSRMGTRQFDNEHPTGSARAANILSCLPSGAE